MSWVGTALQVGGTVFDFIGKQQEAAAAAELADYRAEVATRNAALLEENASRTVAKGQQDQLTQDMAARAVIGDQIAAQGASGIRLSSGSFVRSRAATRKIARLNALNVRQAAAIEAFNLRTQAADYRQEAKFLKKTRNSTLIQGAFSGLGTLARGFGNIDFRSLSGQGA